MTSARVPENREREVRARRVRISCSRRGKKKREFLSGQAGCFPDWLGSTPRPPTPLW